MKNTNEKNEDIYKDLYLPNFDFNGKYNDQKLKQNKLKHFSVGWAIVLNIITFGIFTTFYYGINHSRLPKIKSNDFDTFTGIALLFVPFYNIYWYFIFWLRLVDRINLQLRLREINYKIPRGYFLFAIIQNIIPYLNLITSPIFLSISVAHIQTAINKIVEFENK